LWWYEIIKNTLENKNKNLLTLCIWYAGVQKAGTQIYLWNVKCLHCNTFSFLMWSTGILWIVLVDFLMKVDCSLMWKDIDKTLWCHWFEEKSSSKIPYFSNHT
jgi:hypothetical protein